jgi:hypothetical protein
MLQQFGAVVLAFINILCSAPNAQPTSAFDWPQTWDKALPRSDTTDVYAVVSVAASSAEFRKVHDAFFSTVDIGKFRISSIERIQHPAMLVAYQTKKMVLEKKLKATGGCNEKVAFHGTKADTVPLILQNGFLRDFNTTGRMVYGTVSEPPHYHR